MEKSLRGTWKLNKLLLPSDIERYNLEKMSAQALQIIEVIKGLPLKEKFHILELIFKDIREQSGQHENEEMNISEAAQLLLKDYQNDEELVAFTALDKESFYETKRNMVD